jgi:hypothetical protein
MIFALDPVQTWPFKQDLLRQAVGTLESITSSPTMESSLDGLTWNHRTRTADGTGNGSIEATTVVRTTMSNTRITIWRKPATTILLHFRHHEDDLDVGMAVNQDARTSLRSIGDHLRILRDCVAQIDAHGDPVHPQDRMIDLLRGIAMTEQLDPIHRGQPVWARAPWERGAGMLSQEISRLRLPARFRGWPHGPVTLVGDHPNSSGPGTTFAFGALCERPPEGITPIEQMRLVALAESFRR